MDIIQTLQGIAKSLEAGGYNAAPSTLTQSGALQREDLSTTLELTTYDKSHLFLVEELDKETCKSMLAQFNRQLSYGVFGGSAVRQGAIGREQVGDYVRAVVPMCFYAEQRRVTAQAQEVETFDGKKAMEREAENAAMKLAGDIEHDMFKGRANYSNSGVFDGSPLAMWDGELNIMGIDAQVRQSDLLSATKDLMFAEYGSDESVVLPVGGTLGQDIIEDLRLRSTNAFGNAKELFVSTDAVSRYNKLGFAKERIVLAGSPQTSTGSDLKRQSTAGGEVELFGSQFLRGKVKGAPVHEDSPAQPTLTSAVSTAVSGVTTAFEAAEVYTYQVSACSELGESALSAEVAETIDTDGHGVVLTISHSGLSNVEYFNVYRTEANGSRIGFIGRVKRRAGQSSTLFTDLGNKLPAFTTAFLLQKDTMSIMEWMPFSRTKLAQVDLSTVEVFFQWLTLAVKQPRKNVLGDNVQ